MTKILFICASNAVRSQMAEGWARKLGSEHIKVRSAGMSPSTVHPLAVASMREVGIDISHQGCRHLDDRILKWADWIITLSDAVKPYSTSFPPEAKYDHWSIPNPDTLANDNLTLTEAYARTRDHIKRRVEQLLETIHGK